ncbi:MAG: twinfilin-like domain-containing protein [archaeon]|nr:twinfilin-like domain-containing protein [archaeon]
MTHSSGIPIAESLRDAFAEARSDPGTRAIKVSIVDELMVPTMRIAKRGTDGADFQGLAEHVVAKQPCYFLLKIADAVTGNDQWVFIVYAPDNSAIKDRMLYASSRETCKKSLGSGYFSEDFHVTDASELKWEEFQSHKQGKYVEAPLTATEVEMRLEKHAEIHHGHAHEYVHSVKFPVSQEAFAQLQSMTSSPHKVVFMHVDPVKETIELRGSHTAPLGSLLGLIPQDSPTFCVMRYDHAFNGAQVASYVFIYSCPERSPIKLKMLHSTVKAPAIAGVEKAGLQVAAKIEIDEASELTAEMLEDAIHPQARQVNTKTTFSKPVAAGRGPARRPPARR